MFQHRCTRLLWPHVRGCYSVRRTQRVFVSIFPFHKSDHHIRFNISSQKLPPSCVAQQPPGDEFTPLSRQPIIYTRSTYTSKKKINRSQLITAFIINVEHFGNPSEKASQKITEQNVACLKFKDHVVLLATWKRHDTIRGPAKNYFSKQELTSHCRWGGMFLICSFLVLWR